MHRIKQEMNEKKRMSSEWRVIAENDDREREKKKRYDENESEKFTFSFRVHSVFRTEANTECNNNN